MTAKFPHDATLPTGPDRTQTGVLGSYRTRTLSAGTEPRPASERRDRSPAVGLEKQQQPRGRCGAVRNNENTNSSDPVSAHTRI